MKKTKNSIILFATLISVLILQGCYTQMETTKKVKVTRRPVHETRAYTYTQPVENDSLVFYQDEDGYIYFKDEFGNINYVEDDSSFSTAYQKGFAIETPITQVKEYHHYYYDDPYYYNTYDPYYDHLSWNLSFTWGNRYYDPHRWDRHYVSYYSPYYDPYWGYSPWYSYNGGYYWTHQ